MFTQKERCSSQTRTPPQYKSPKRANYTFINGYRTSRGI